MDDVRHRAAGILSLHKLRMLEQAGLMVVSVEKQQSLVDVITQVLTQDWEPKIWYAGCRALHEAQNAILDHELRAKGVMKEASEVAKGSGMRLQMNQSVRPAKKRRHKHMSNLPWVDEIETEIPLCKIGEYDACNACVAKLIAAVRAAEKALEWYGMQMTYEYIKDESAPILYDRGDKARGALAKLQSGEFGEERSDSGC